MGFYGKTCICGFIPVMKNGEVFKKFQLQTNGEELLSAQIERSL